MATTHISGPLNVAGDQLADRLPYGTDIECRSYGGSTIADGVATAILTLSIPNVATSLRLGLRIRAGMTTTSHKYDSTRIITQAFVVTRTPGKAAVGVAATAIETQIATVSAGSTFTAALAVGSVTGGATGVDSVPITITLTGGGSDTFDLDVEYDLTIASITSAVQLQ